jgi:formylglycine-generating enzyme required for sulfatase activity
MPILRQMNSRDGENSLNRGHSNGSAALAATGAEDTSWSPNRRTHKLSNGEVIWDLAGNVWEWVYDDNITKQGLNGYVAEGLAKDKAKWGPAGDYSYEESSKEKGGLGYGYLNDSAGAVLRGGGWSVETKVGVFNASLYSGPSDSNNLIGFRCARSLQ